MASVGVSGPFPEKSSAPVAFGADLSYVFLVLGARLFLGVGPDLRAVVLCRPGNRCIVIFVSPPRRLRSPA